MSTKLSEFNRYQQITGCRVVATANVAGTYSNGPSNTGVGATLTAASAAVLTIDSVALVLGNRVLLTNQTTALQNGVYIMTTQGTTTTAWVLTRTNDFDTVEVMKPGYFIPIAAGSVNAGAVYVVTEPQVQTVGVSTPTFVPANGATTMVLFGTISSPDASPDLVSFDVTVGQAALATGGAVTLIASTGAKQYRIRQLQLNSGGTNFSGGGGDRLGQVTDGTTVYSVVPAATLQALVNGQWGVTAIPNPASAAINTKTAAGASLTFKYSSGTTDYTAGSLVITGLAERVA